ncbi:MAG: hypothetical protein GY906_10895 [bacterium]|nr:hypothetical protein [bacterium]
MPVRAMGPTYAGGTQPVVLGGYNLIFMPDVNNWELQRSGQAPVFYWVPNQIRMARKEGPDSGDYLFNLIRFAGAQSAEGTVGASEDREVAGGVLTFTVTGSPPDRVLQEAQQKIIDRYQSSDEYFWGIRSRLSPIFRPALISSNATTISNISPTPRGTARGSVPLAARRSGARSNMLVFRNAGMDSVSQAPARGMPRSVRSRDAAENSSNLEPWYWRMQGEGSGSIDPAGQNAFSALLGAYPTAILWESFHGTASPVTVIQDMRLKVWTPIVDLTIRGNWDRIFEHFSAAVHAHYLWASADIQAEFNNMRMSGTIEVELKIDSTIPNGEKIIENIEKRSDLVYEKFMEEARRVIFEPPQPEVEAAEASSSSGPWGVSVALKYRRDERHLDLYYHESRQLAYLQQHTPSSSLSGMFEEMQSDPDAERKYFRTVYLDDWPRKLARTVKPICAWSDGAVNFLSVQLGYPNTQGELMWEGHVFQEREASNDSWLYRMVQKNLADVTNPPEGWQPDMTYVKRKVHLNEPPSELEDPYRRFQIDRNVIDIDVEPNGIMRNDINLEVRADSAGRLAVGPIELGVVLQDNTQTVEVMLEPTDDRSNPVGRETVRFVWNEDDQDRDRIWFLFTGDPTFRSFFRYKVRVLVKGTIFEPGREWEGPWVAANGNGPITLSIPRPGDTGVTERVLPSEFASPRGDSETSEHSEGTASRTTSSSEGDTKSVQGWPLSRS